MQTQSLAQDRRPQANGRGGLWWKVRVRWRCEVQAGAARGDELGLNEKGRSSDLPREGGNGLRVK
jgi:hypothetical protein